MRHFKITALEEFEKMEHTEVVKLVKQAVKLNKEKGSPTIR